MSQTIEKKTFWRIYEAVGKRPKCIPKMQIGMA